MISVKFSLTSFLKLIHCKFCFLEEEREVSKEQGQELAKQFKCTFLEASAKYRVNVPEVMHVAFALSFELK